LDHLIIAVTLSTSPCTSSRGYWRLPRELLTNPVIREAVTAEAEQRLTKMTSRTSTTPPLNIGAMWHGWLKRIKARLQECHRRYIVDTKAILHDHLMRLAVAQRDYQRTGHGAAAVHAAEAALDTATAELRQCTMDVHFDFHANTNEEGSRHFFRRPQGSKVSITKANVDGGVATDAPTVQAVFTAHWQTIMTSPPDLSPPNRARRRAVLRRPTQRLSDADREQLVAPLTPLELRSALKTMDPSKSPGPDGWYAGFFQLAPDVFADIVLLVYQYQLVHRRELLPHQRRSAVTLLFKAGDRGDHSNYRPIALMPVEVKVLPRALARRLAYVAPKLAHRSQARFIPDRRLHDHVVFVQSLQHYCTMEDHDHYATFLAFSKAYDMVYQGFLIDTLHELNIRPVFLSWVALLYRA
ncbi:hypothetical protein ACHHYP_20297, partial [Achlya hypogyna]